MRLGSVPTETLLKEFVVIASELELILFGAWLADPEIRDSIPLEILGPELSSLLVPPKSSMAKRTWDWLKSFRVTQVDDEKPLPAIIRTLIADKLVRDKKQEIRKIIRENCDVSGVTQLRELLDRVMPHSDPKST